MKNIYRGNQFHNINCNGENYDSEFIGKKFIKIVMNRKIHREKIISPSGIVSFIGISLIIRTLNYYINDIVTI